MALFNSDIYHLVMGNAGWPGTNEAVLKYIDYLATNYNILVNHQFPWSFETKMIDLGAWMNVKILE